MIIKNLDKFKITTTKQAVTSFAGLPLLLGMAKNLGLEAQFNALPLKERARGYKPAESALALMGLIQSGGEALDDVSLLKGDEGLGELWGGLPAANTLGEWLRRYGCKTVHQLGRIQLGTAAKVVRASKLSRVTLDVDSFFLESQKSDVEMNYEGLWGYNPVAVTCSELKMPMAGIFRKGTASPMANIAALLKRAIGVLAGIKIRVRSDSAGFQAKVVRVLGDAGTDFTVTMRKDENVMESIYGIPEARWAPYKTGAWRSRVCEIAEDLHVFVEANDLPAYRMIVIRWPKEEPGLFDKSPYEYHAVLTSLDNWPAGLVLQFHRTRQDGSENVNKELSGGFGLSKLPCREFMANAAYFQMALLSCTVAAAFRHLVLPESWRHLTIKTLRFKMIRLAGIVSWRARYLWLKIPENYPFRQVFENARYRLQWLSGNLAAA
jgi:hypothetical protein